jgi:hypothetical protein
MIRKHDHPLLWKNETVLDILPCRSEKRIATKKENDLAAEGFILFFAAAREGKEKASNE